MIQPAAPLDYHQRANLNRPSDRTAIAEEVRRLSRSGLTSRDIAAALGMTHTAIELMLKEAA